jgi:hypothetical protein
MNSILIPVFYALVAIAALWLVLLWCARVKPGRRTRVVAVIIGLATLCLLIIPVGGLPLWGGVFGFFANPSLPMIGIVCAALWRRLFGTRVLSSNDWRALWLFGAIAGTGLYLHPVIFGGGDPYYWGWNRNGAVLTFATTAVVLLACGSRLGVLVLAALIAYGFSALESQNSWDYIVDPIYWLISVAVMAVRLVARAIRFAREVIVTRFARVGIAEPNSDYGSLHSAAEKPR